MRMLSALLATAALQAATAQTPDEELPRNPFWPRDYEGTRYPISAEPRFKPQPTEEETETVKKKSRPTRSEQESAKLKAEREAAEAAKKAEEKLWADAVQTLEFGATSHFSMGDKVTATVQINDRVYGVGDLMSANCGELRFTWLVEAISSDGKLKLKRLQHKPLIKKEEK